MQLNDQQQRALNKYGAEAQMQKTGEELSELIQPIFKALYELRTTGTISQKTLWSLKKEFYDVEFMLPQFEAILASFDEGYEHDMKAIAAAEVRRMEDRLAEE